jgi:hypothetical protein
MKRQTYMAHGRFAFRDICLDAARRRAGLQHEVAIACMFVTCGRWHSSGKGFRQERTKFLITP